MNLEKIIDNYLEKWVSEGLNTLPVKSIQKEMADPNQSESEEWKTWYPVQSMVEENEIREFEERIGFKLPESCKRL